VSNEPSAPPTFAHDKTLAASDWRTLIGAHPQLAAAAATALRANPRHTIVPTAANPSDSKVFVAEKLSQRLLAARDSVTDTLQGYSVREPLGQGGMGIIHRADQLVLDRPVAIKTLRSEQAGDLLARTRLLREAWLNGRLEHPNIVPIHDLRVDDAGIPFMVMRKVTGLRWDELLRDDAQVRRRFDVLDVREWHLRVLLQVAQAITCAHAAQIVHRDIKPDNVMIGDYGEVYLLDWGIAVTLEPEATEPERTSEIAGTPCYMAPEMLGFGGAIDTRTDVYLLGATLYEIVVGKPPHDGATTFELTSRILASAPELPPGLSPALCHLIRTAMRADPQHRYASAQDFVRALTLYLTYRGSEALALSATEERERLRELLGQATVTRRQIYDAYGSAKFGYQAALRAWPDNVDAHVGHQQLVELLARDELAQGAPEAAQALLIECTAAPLDLTTGIELALAARHAERARLAQLTEQAALNDPTVGRGTRRVIGGALCAVGAVAPLAIEFQSSKSQSALQPIQVAVRTGIWLILVMLVMFVVRHKILRTTVNRNIAFAVAWGFCLPLLLLAAEVTMGTPLRYHIGLSLFSWVAVMGVTAFHVNRWFSIPAFVYFVASAVAIRFPEYRYYAASIANLIGLTLIVLGWSVPRARSRHIRLGRKVRSEN
jgi:eukaryotic-like serine/threonine-protein kinase